MATNSDDNHKGGVVSVEWEEYQKKTIKEWINTQMKPYGIEVNDVYSDLFDGFIIDKMVQLVATKASQHGNTKKIPSSEEAKHKTNFSNFKKDLSSSSPNDVSPAFKLARQRETLVKALSKMRELGIALGNIAVEDIISGNAKMTLALVWKLIRFAEDRNLMSTEESSFAPETPTGNRTPTSSQASSRNNSPSGTPEGTRRRAQTALTPSTKKGSSEKTEISQSMKLESISEETLPEEEEKEVTLATF